MFAKHNPNPYQIDLCKELKELSDPNQYIQSSKKGMNSSIIKLTPLNLSYLENTIRTPIITTQPHSSMLSKIAIPPANINPSSRLNQTTMILSKIIPGKNGEPDY
eukprot:47101_1